MFSKSLFRRVRGEMGGLGKHSSPEAAPVAEVRTHMKSGRKFPRNAPRYSAGSMDLKGGTGGITAMCPCDGFLEIYKADVTFRVMSPESVDPDETNPNAPWIASMVDDVGSSSLAVARILLQGHDILKSAAFGTEVDTASVLQVLHSCKEAAVVCEKTAHMVNEETDSIVESIKKSGIERDNHGRGLNPFPQVSQLPAQATTFLIHAKRAIQYICKLPAEFLAVSAKDSNFDHLGNTVEVCLGPSAPVVEFIRGSAAGVKRLIDLRNYQEHPGAKRTTILNFRVLPNGAIAPPMWHVSDEPPTLLAGEMVLATEFLVHITEVLLLHLVMHSVKKTFPFYVQEIGDEDIDLKKPIKYRLSIDMSKMRMKTDQE